MKQLHLTIIFTFLIAGLLRAQTNEPNDDYFPSPMGSASPVPATPTYYVNPYLPAFNYVRNWVPRTPLTSLTNPWQQKVSMNTVYRNGFGTPLQTIAHGGLGQWDIVKVNEQIPGKMQVHYLPYVDSNKSTAFRMDAYTDQDAYNSGKYPYESGYNFGKTLLEIDSQVSHVHSYSPGASFTGVSNGTTSYTLFNDETNPDDWVYSWNFSGPGGNPEILGGYSSNELSVQISTIEPHNIQTRIYSDKNGRTICKKVKSGTDWLATYYVYDDLGRINWIIPPKAVPSVSSYPYTLPTTVKDSLCYYYKYNEFGKAIEKRTPDRSGLEKVVYDKMQRPVLMQNPILAEGDQWEYTVYDDHDRVSFSGIFTDPDANSRIFWQERVLEDTGWSGLTTYQPIVEYLRHGITITSITPVPASISNCEINKVNYYDNYTDLPPVLSGRNFLAHTNDYLTFQEAIIPQPTDYTDNLLTATRVRVLDPGNGNRWINSVYFYDFEGRLIQSHTLNPWNAANQWDVNSSQYDFNGNVILSIAEHNSWATADKASTTIKIQNDYNYLTGNFVAVKQKIDTGAWLDIVSYTYDEQDKVKQKILGKVEEQVFTYNIRGQLTGVNEDYVYDVTKDNRRTYGEIIYHDYGFEESRFDGKATGYKYRGAGRGSYPRAYGYLYDDAGRLTKGDFYERLDPNSPPPTIPSPDWHKGTDYTAFGITYDKNGNMLTLKQKGMALVGGNITVVDMDDLTYNYHGNSNRLHSVADAVSANYNLHDFLDGNIENEDYGYDANGNLKQDLNKGISDITYSYMDLPEVITSTNGSISKMYDAAGTLLQKITVDNVAGTSDTERYWGTFVYKNDSLKYLLHQEGRSRYNSDSDIFYNDFFVKDHLGNVRTVVQSEMNWGMPSVMSAGWEIMSSTVEEATFEPIGPIRDTKPLGNPNDLMSGLLNGQNANERIGAAILLHGMAGDKFEMGGYGYYEEGGPFENYTMPEFMLESLTDAMIGGSGEGTEGGPVTTLVGNLLTSTNYNVYDGIVSNSTDPAYPRMYLNYLVFDESFNLMPDHSGAVQLKGASNTWHQIVPQDVLTMPVNGYLLSYYSNSSDINTWVDNIYIAHYKGTLLEETHYYPHGLTIDGGGQNTTPLPNDYLHQAKKLERALGVELYDFHARQYDPQIGRFWGVDPADQFPSGYTGMANDPANMIDPTGMLATSSGGGVGNTSMPMGDYSNMPSGRDFSDLQRQLGFEYEHDLYFDDGAGGGGGGGGVGSETDQDKNSENKDNNGKQTTAPKADNILTNTALGRAAVAIATAINTNINPFYFVGDGIKGYVTGENFLGNKVHWTESTSSIISAIPISKASALIYEVGEQGIRAANKMLARKYLANKGQLNNFADVHGFKLYLGSTNYVYHEAYSAVVKTRWSTPLLYNNKNIARMKLALDYEGSKNFASLRYKTTSFGFFVTGTAAPQGRTIGYGLQNYRTSFGINTNFTFLGW